MATEDKAVVVPTTAELMAFPDGASTAEALSDLLIDAIGGVQCQDDWARQYEVRNLCCQQCVIGRSSC